MRKSASNRIKITKTGKILHRQMGLDHFRAKKSRRQIYRKAGLNPAGGTLAKNIIKYLHGTG